MKDHEHAAEEECKGRIGEREHRTTPLSMEPGGTVGAGIGGMVPDGNLLTGLSLWWSVRGQVP